MLFAAATGSTSSLLLNLAYLYVGLRVVHSLIQVLVSKVMPRFMIFVISTLVLIGMAAIEVVRVFLS